MSRLIEPYLFMDRRISLVNQITLMREFKDIQIAVAGTGYVGLSIATLLAQHHKVTAVDVTPEAIKSLIVA